MSTLSKNLASLRKKAGLSQKNAAKELGISQALLSHYEKGIRECGLEFLSKAATFYNVSTDFLLGREDNDAILSLVKALDGNSSSTSEHERSKRKILHTLSRFYQISEDVQNKKLQEELDQAISIYLYHLMRVLQSSSCADSSYFQLPDDRALLLSQSYLQTCYLRICKRVEALPSKKQELIDFGSKGYEEEHPISSYAIKTLISDIESKYKKI